MNSKMYENWLNDIDSESNYKLVIKKEIITYYWEDYFINETSCKNKKKEKKLIFINNFDNLVKNVANKEIDKTNREELKEIISNIQNIKI